MPLPENKMGRDGITTVTLVIFCQLIHGISFSAMPLLLPLTLLSQVIQGLFLSLPMVAWPVLYFDIRIRHGEFSPMVLTLRQGWPYVLRIRNRDDRARMFAASDFLSKVAVIKTTVAGVEDDPRPTQHHELQAVREVEGVIAAAIADIESAVEAAAAFTGGAVNVVTPRRANPLPRPSQWVRRR